MWRYSRIDDLDLDDYAPLQAPPGPVEPTAEARELLGALGPDALVVRTSGGWAEAPARGSPSLAVEDLSIDGHARVGLGSVAGEPDPFVALNGAFSASPLRLRVPPGARPPVVVVLHTVSAEGAAVFPRLLVEVGEGADVTVVEVLSGEGRALVVPVTELEVGDRASMRYLSVQLLGTSAWQLGLQASRVGREASLCSAAISLGGDYARLRTDSSLVSPGASSRLLAVYFGSRSQMHDFRTLQAHRAERTTSDLLYKGAVANSSRSVYSGLIRVEKGARGTNAFQTNRNLVLHEGAHADSVPNLEIEDNDVRCSHASAVGPIAEDQRFYLGSRGVPPQVGDRLIALGFLDEVLSQLPVPGVANPLRLDLARKLAEAEAAEGGRG